jgi:MFS family permease
MRRACPLVSPGDREIPVGRATGLWGRRAMVRQAGAGIASVRRASLDGWCLADEATISSITCHTPYDADMATTTAPPAGSTPREPLWTRNYILTLVSMHFFFLAWAMLFSTLPLYLEDAKKWQVGWVVSGAFGVASLAVRVWSGRVVDRYGRRLSMALGAAVTGLATAGFILTDSPLLLTPVRLVYGVAACFYTTAGMAMLADVLPASRRGEGMGWYGVFYTTTNVYGPWFGLTLAEAISLPVSFLAGAAALLACGAVSALIRENRTDFTPPADGRLISRSALVPTGGFIPLAIAFSTLPAFLVLFAKQRDLGNAGIFFFLLGVALVVGRWFGGSAADRIGRRAVILPGFILGASGMAMLALAPSSSIFYAAALIFGVGFALGHTGLTILTVDRAPANERGAAMATFVLAWDFGTLGSFLLSFVADAINLRALFLAAAALPLVALVAFEAVRRREDSYQAAR